MIGNMSEERAGLVPGAAMCVWRVYGIHNDYLSSRADGEADWSTEIPDWPQRRDTTRINIGGPPYDLIHAVKSAMATALTVFSGGEWRLADNPMMARDEAIKEHLKTMSDDNYSHITKGFGLWITISIRRPVDIRDATGSLYAWADARQAMEYGERFKDEAGKHLDLSTAVVATALGDVVIDRTLSGSNPVYFVAPNKEPFTLGQWNVPSPTVSVSQPWNHIPFDNIVQTVTAAKKIPPKSAKGLSSSARLLWLAKAEKEDRLRRFLFAFTGLEVLIGAIAGKDSGRREEVGNLLSEETGLPINQMMWPAANPDSPERNLVFRFVIMAISFTRDTATADTAIFRRLAETRNLLAHGSSSTADDFPDRECIALLDRYMALAIRKMAFPGQAVPRLKDPR